MPSNFSGFVQSAITTFSALVSVFVVTAQAPLVDQLKTQYKIVKLAPDSTGLTVLQPGTVLAIQQGGLLGVPPANPVECAAKFQDGALRPPGGFCVAMVQQVSRYFQKGEKVYPLKIDVNIKKEQVSFHVVACDSCNGTDPATFFKSEVQFQFAKGYLETASAAQVQDAINQVFAVDAGAPQQAQSAQPPAAPAAQPPAPPPPAVEPPPAPIPPPPPPADQPPQTIDVGQTVDQVVAALGQPQRIAKVGAKQIYFYKDLKVTFNNGKVSDVE